MDADSLSGVDIYEEWHGGLLATIGVTIIVMALYVATWMWRKGIWSNHAGKAM